MKVLLKISRAIDAVNEKFGFIANYLVLFAALISAGNAASRYLFSDSSNAWLEIQWYMFAAMVLLGAPYTLKVNEHVRVDLVYGMVSRAHAHLDRHHRRHPVPAADLHHPDLFHLAVVRRFLAASTKCSSNAGGLIRWPVKLLLPVGFGLMALQGISEIIKRIAALEHVIDIEFNYEKPLQ